MPHSSCVCVPRADGIENSSFDVDVDPILLLTPRLVP